MGVRDKRTLVYYTSPPHPRGISKHPDIHNEKHSIKTPYSLIHKEQGIIIILTSCKHPGKTQKNTIGRGTQLAHQ